MLALLFLGLGCAPPTAEDARADWLVDALLRDNAVWLSRDASLLEAKLATMANDPYAFLRGTLGVAWADQARPGATRVATQFLSTPGADAIWLAGDPHPENFSLFAAPHLPATVYNQPLCIDLEDFDGSGHGPWTWDLRRLLLGVRLAADLSGACDAACASSLTDAVADGYFDTIQTERVPDLCAPKTEGEALGRAAERAESDALGKVAFETLTGRSVFQPERAFLTGATPDANGDGVLSLTPAERAQVERLWRQLDDLPPGARIVDAARRYGAGVASQPAVRYLVLWDVGDSASDADDHLVQLREVVDPPLIPGRFRPMVATLGPSVDRVRAPADALWSHDDLDPWLLGVADGAQLFKRTSWSDLPAGLEADDLAEDLAEGKTTPEDVAALAGALARRLAGAHRNAPTLAGEDAAAILRTELSGRREALRAELDAATDRDLQQLYADVEALRQMLEHLGPDLGASRLGAPMLEEIE